MLRNRRFHYSVLITAIVGMAMFSVRLSSRISDLEQKCEGLESEARLVALENILRAPTETILCGGLYTGNLNREIAELKREFYAAHDIHEFAPYQSVARQSGLSYMGQYPDGRLTDVWSTDTRSVQSGTSEEWWLMMGNDWLGRLAGQLERGLPIDSQLKVNPDEFRDRIGPLVIRWLRSYACMPRANAARVLLAMGDRSPELTRIVQLTMYDEGARSHELRGVCARYDIPLPDGLTVDGEWPKFSIELHIEKWRQVRELVDTIEQRTRSDYLERNERLRANRQL